jgi:hypothetical protein
MQSVVGIALLVVGVVLIIFGMQASASLGSRLSELFTGAPVTGRFGSSSWGWSRLFLASVYCLPDGAERCHDAPTRPSENECVTSGKTIL